MARYATAASTLSAALGLALGLQLAPVSAQEMNKGKDEMSHAATGDPSHAMADKLEKCYGINAAAKNDCAAGASSCAGQATRARDPKAFVLLPAGACNKIAGGKLNPS
jgi:uncharacterized membrane protein